MGLLAAIHEQRTLFPSEPASSGSSPGNAFWASSLPRVWATVSLHLCTSLLTRRAWPLPAPISGTMMCLIHSHAPHRPTSLQVTPIIPRMPQACAISQWSSVCPSPWLGTAQVPHPT